MTSNQAAENNPINHSPIDDSLSSLLKHSRTRVIFGSGMLDSLGEIAREEGASGVLLVSDPGIVRAGHVARAEESIRAANLEVFIFNGVQENPTTDHVCAGVDFARQHDIDFIIGLGGGSSMDCAKGINFILSNGGQMSDYW